MNRRSRTVVNGALTLLILLGGGVLHAEPLTLDGAVDLALRVNTDFQNTQLAADRALNSLPALMNWKDIAVTVTHKQTSDPAKSSTSLGLNLPLMEQLGASASVDQEKNTQVTLSSRPLSHSDSAVQARIGYEKTILTASLARIALETAVRKAYLTQVSAEALLKVQTKKAVLKETAYQDEKVRYNKGLIGLSEVRTALQNWIQARSSQTVAERNLVKAQTDLAGRLQTEFVEVSPIDIGAVEAQVNALGQEETRINSTPTAVKVQSLEAQAQRAKADALWLFDPELVLSANASIPVKGEPAWSGSVTLTLALGDWMGVDKTLAERSAALARQTLETQESNSRSAEVQALLAVEAARDNVETRTLALTQAKELLTETRLLAKAGDAAALEVEEADLGVTSSEIDLYMAWADLYTARLDLDESRW